MHSIYRKKRTAAAVMALLLTLAGTGCSDKKGNGSSSTSSVSSSEASAYSADIESPTFSEESGFYSDPLSVEINAPEGCTVYYTTDGSMPTLDSQKYSGPIKVEDRSEEDNVLSTNIKTTYPSAGMLYAPKDPVAKGTVIRAAAADKDGRLSLVATKSYFIGFDLSERYNGLPIISISVNADDLYNEKTGIYNLGEVWDVFKDDEANKDLISSNTYWKYEANFTQHGKEWEKPVHVDFFEGDGKLGFSEDMGMRITGKASRAAVQKSLKFYARKEYGSGKVDYELIPDAKTSTGSAITKYDTFVIRNGANDNQGTKFRDPCLQELVKDRDFETQQGRPVIAFIDGEFWGVYHINEDYSGKYIQESYGYPSKEVVIIKNGELEDGEESDLADYKELLEFVRGNDLSSAENYEKLCNMVDIQSMADYFAAQMYIGNEDLFYEDSVNNYRMWKMRNKIDDAEGDGRWRWMLYDVDFSSNVYGGNEGGSTKTIEDSQFTDIDTVIFTKTLNENESFRQLFFNTALDIANNNFTEDKVEAMIEKYKEMYMPVMKEHFDRFGPAYIVPSFSSTYPSSIGTLKSFFRGRTDVFIGGLQNVLGAGDISDMTLWVNDQSMGTIKVNTISPQFVDNNWKCRYFSDIPVTLTAVPAEGHTFTGWVGDAYSTDTTIEVLPRDVYAIQADFQ